MSTSTTSKQAQGDRTIANDSEVLFRDGTAGAEARRQELLRKRRDELALMGHSIRRIFIKRSAMIVSCAALSLVGAAVIATSASEDFYATVAGLLQGERPAAILNLLGAALPVAIFAYLFASTIAEKRFSAAMSRAVLPSKQDNIHQDVDRLHKESPNYVGRRMAQRFEQSSRMAPVLAFGAIGPALVFLTYNVVSAGGYPHVTSLEHDLARGDFLQATIAGTAIAFVLAMRLSRAARTTLGALATTLSVTLLGALTLNAFCASGSCLPYQPFGSTSKLFLFLVVAGALPLVLVARLSARWHSKQNRLMDMDTDPIPPSLDLGKRLRAAASRARTAIATGLAALWSTRRRRIATACAALGMCATLGAHFVTQESSTADAHVITAGEDTAEEQHLPLIDTFQTDQYEWIGRPVYFHADDTQGADNLNLPQLSRGWEVSVTVSSRDLHKPVLVKLQDGGEFLELEPGSSISKHFKNCGNSPRALVFDAQDRDAVGVRSKIDEAFTLHYRAELRIADCFLEDAPL